MVRPGVWQLHFASGQLPERLIDIASDDAALVISMSRYSRDTIEHATWTAARAPTVILTDEHASPLRATSDLVVTFSTTPAAMFRSLTAAVSTLQALIAATTRHIGPSAVQKRLEQADSIWSEFGTFHIRRREDED